MEAEARYAWVGAAVIALSALLVAGVWWLADVESQEVRRYVVYFEQQSLEGLQTSSDVRMQGLKVGKVEDYTILPGATLKVRVLLQVDARTPVLEGARASLNRNLVTGLAVVELDNPVDNPMANPVDNGGRDGVPLMRTPPGEAYPVIAEGTPKIALITENIETLARSGQAAIDRVNAVLSERNQVALSNSLEHLEALGGEMRSTLPALRATLTATRQAADSLRTVGKEAASEFVGLSHDARATLADARQRLAGMDSELRDLNVRLKLASDLGLQEVQASAQAARVIRDTVEDAGPVLRDPGKVLYAPPSGALGPGER